MKYNTNTSMELRLQEAIQELLHSMNTARNIHVKSLFRAQLSGIITSLHALRDEEWDICTQGGKYVLINEDGTECITEP